MAHQIAPKDPNNQIVLITISNPFNARTESAEILGNLQAIFGNITSTIYTIYDLRQLTLSFSDIIIGLSSSIAHPRSEFEKQLAEHARLILVGSGTMANLGAKSASRFTPDKPLPVFRTLDEALAYANAEIAHQRP